MDHLIDVRSFFKNVSRPFSRRKGQSPWPDAQQSLTPAQASAMSSSLAQVSVRSPLCIYFPLLKQHSFTLLSSFIVNVSAGPAGLVCAETLRQEGFTDRIVMCTMDRHPPYDRPKLSKVCTQTPTT